MTKYRELRDKIHQYVASVQIDGVDAFAQVSDEPLSQFEGTPAATIVPAEVTSDIESNWTNVRQYGFNIHLHYPLDDGVEWTSAINTLMDLSDATMDVLDRSDDLGRTNDILMSAPLDWDIAQAGDKLEIFCTIHVIAKVSIKT